MALVIAVDGLPDAETATHLNHHDFIMSLQSALEINAFSLKECRRCKSCFDESWESSWSVHPFLSYLCRPEMDRWISEAFATFSS